MRFRDSFAEEKAVKSWKRREETETMRRWTAVFLTMVLVCLVFAVPALSEEIKEWNCPECGREGNTNKFCGGCGYAWPGPDCDTTLDLVNLKIGDTFLFGSYEQDNDLTNGKEDIRWIVLDMDENSVLLLSEMCLNNVQYYEKFADTNWEESTIRDWLKQNFIPDAFTKEEQGFLLSRHNVNLPGNATEDQVFLLSEEEAGKYLPEKQDRIAAATPYAIARGATTDDSHKTAAGDPATKWWLRDGRYSDMDSNYIITVDTDGRITVGIKNNNKHTAVRPAILLRR